METSQRWSEVGQCSGGMLGVWVHHGCEVISASFHMVWLSKLEEGGAERGEVMVMVMIEEEGALAYFWGVGVSELLQHSIAVNLSKHGRYLLPSTNRGARRN